MGPHPPARSYDERVRLSLRAAAVAVVVAAVLVPASPGAPPAPSFEGRIVFSRGGPHGGLYVLRAGRIRPVRLTARPGDDHPAWSPDGRRVAFVRYEGGRADLYLVRVDGSGLRRLTRDGRSYGPSWSPRGGEIAFGREAAGGADVYALDVETGHVRRLTRDRLVEGGPAWSPDGSRIVLAGYLEGAPPSPLRLYVVGSRGSRARRLGPRDATSPSWSPDGRRIAFVDATDGSIRMLGPDGGRVRKLLDLRDLPGGGSFAPNFTSRPAWSSDGGQLVFAAGSPATSHLYLLDLPTSSVRQLTRGRVQDESPAWFEARR